MTKRSAIAAVSPEPKVIDVFGLGVDNQVLHRRLMSGEPTTPDWEALGGPVTSAPTAVATGAGRLALCALDSNNSLQAKTFDGQNWAPSKTEWFSLGGICTRETLINAASSRVAFLRRLDFHSAGSSARIHLDL